jgi:hypothetical protein
MQRVTIFYEAPMPDPRETADALREATTAVMVFVDRMAVLSAGADVQVRFTPAHGEPFTVVGEDEDMAYVSRRMEARKAALIAAAVAKLDELKADLEALL